MGQFKALSILLCVCTIFLYQALSLGVKRNSQSLKTIRGRANLLQRNRYHAILSQQLYSPLTHDFISNVAPTYVRRMNSLKMVTYSSAQGVPAALVEERDACGVGFVATLNNKPSHSIVKQALDACSCMEHRGATSADNISGDGAGIMTAIPWELLADLVDPQLVQNGDGSTGTAVGMIFLPRDQKKRSEVIAMIERTVVKGGLRVVAWRDVPSDASVLGSLSADFVPNIQQLIIQSASNNQFKSEKDMENQLYDVRREIQGYFRKLEASEAYICSLSSKTIVYKGMLRSCDLPRFYKDLDNPAYKSVFAVYHRRFSTNTNPKWFLAQPMRFLAHNGEINTLLGNINWVKSRQYAKTGESQQGEEEVRGPLVDVGRSDSANLDSILNSLVAAGRSPEEALMILVPEAYQSQPKLAKEEGASIKAFYSYFESMQEAWDGPALLVFSDGDSIGAALDRNGLRPARYMITHNSETGEKLVHVMSEVGVTKALQQFSDDGTTASKLNIIDSGRLGPGEMLSVNLQDGKFSLNDDVKNSVASKYPYKDWTKETIIEIPNQCSPKKDIENFIGDYIRDPANQIAASAVNFEKDVKPVAIEVDDKDFISKQTFFGWGTEDVEVQISAMAAEAVEATYCMGDDAPLAVLSAFPHSLYDYFKQRFAQVTNPPIDPLREGAVMSLTMYLGPRGDPMSLDSQPKKRVKIESPILTSEDVKNLSEHPDVALSTISTLYSLNDGLTSGGLVTQIDKICDQAVEAVQNGATIINLSDEIAGSYAGMTYVSPLLAVGAVHHRLIEKGLRTKASIIVTTGQAWSTHHMACLVGYGASAIVPYAAYHAVLNWHGQKRNLNAMERGDLPKLSPAKAIANYKKSLDKGLLKILSKMGISLLTSYHGAQIFEVLGFNDDVIAKAFKGTPCRVSGMTFDNIAAEGIEFARKAYGDQPLENIIARIEADDQSSGRKLFNYGFLNYLKSGEYHHNNQPLIKTLHSAIRTKDMNLYKLYEESILSRPPTTLRDSLQFSSNEIRKRSSIPLDQVESVESIMSRFCSGGMSLGALSREAHETLAISMNRIGGKSNSGEGGEDPIRMNTIKDVDEVSGVSTTFPHLKGLQNGDIASSKIKQIASGRFGVTPQYLMSAQQLEIKVAQGAKPGEGGQLPGGKIDDYIATLRKSKPGVTLISPPPHHDIYSIEDLAQLIYDLHTINPAAGVSVKLVSEVGIGTIASGVAKAGADIIQISGHDGGTGASPASSIKHAGSPWELGLVESHSSLRKNGLRNRVLLRVDGGLKSGWDVVMAAAMGAEEFGFGTIAMIAEGCIMARICHTNKCPVGVTTQNEALRKRFPGTPDNVATFFGYVAEEVRHILAELGYSTLEEIIGRPGMLQPRTNLQLKKIETLDTSFVLDSLTCAPSSSGDNFCDVDEDRSWLNHGPIVSNGYIFDDKVLEDADISTAIVNHGVASRNYHITNIDRSAFARVSGKIASLHGDRGFKGRLKFGITGAAGQSFCAFLIQGVDITLRGYANDYVCKGMAGGKVAIAAPSNDNAASASMSLVGNTVLYGATGGSLFVRGRGGERFAVRNSGALGVIEGLGDHACEYMTAGTIICLGSTGRNFGAGMTGGVAFVLDDERFFTSSKTASPQQFTDFLNGDTVTTFKLSSEYPAAKNFLQETLQSHFDETGSERAKKILDNLDDALSMIWAIVPNSEKSNALIQKVSQPVSIGSNVNA